MRFLLDTCVVSDFSRGEPGTLDRIKSTPPVDIAVSAVTEMEIVHGLRLNAGLSRRLKPVIEAFLGSVHVLPYDRSAALASARVRAALRRRGQPIGAYDVLIAGTALAEDLVLVTSNLNEFGRIEALRLDNWRRQ